jgi:hypothetical protein
MTPATTTLKIFRGSKWDNEIRFYQTGTTTPLNLTGLEPFVMEIRRKQGSPYSCHSPTRLLISRTDGSGSRQPQRRHSLYRNLLQHRTPFSHVTASGTPLNNPYAEAVMEIHPFTPDPA